MKVLCAGTFDILHPGHLFFLKEAKKYGDELIVIIARDKTVETEKKRKTIFDENARLELLSSLKFVDKALLGDEKDKLKIVEEIKPDIIVIGPNQPVNVEKLEKNLKKRGLANIRIVKLEKKFGDWSSSRLIAKIKKLK